MTEKPVPISELHDLLLPTELRIELCITDLTESQDRQALSFRLDPGRAYARHGYIRNFAGSYTIGILQRYLPDDKPLEVTGVHGLPLADVPDEMRAANGRAYDQTASQPHWRQACPRQRPEWTTVQPGLTPVATTRAARTADQQARESGQAIYTSAAEGGYICSNNPPEADNFLSVTPQGRWSMHSETHTYPIDGTPNASAFVTMRTTTDLPAIRFDRRPTRIGGDGARLTAIDLDTLQPRPGVYRGPNGSGPGPTRRTP